MEIDCSSDLLIVAYFPVLTLWHADGGRKSELWEFKPKLRKVLSVTAVVVL
jgi:hypothetical protein